MPATHYLQHILSAHYAEFDSAFQSKLDETKNVQKTRCLSRTIKKL